MPPLHAPESSLTASSRTGASAQEAPLDLATPTLPNLPMREDPEFRMADCAECGQLFRTVSLRSFYGEALCQLCCARQGHQWDVDPPDPAHAEDHRAGRAPLLGTSRISREVMSTGGGSMQINVKTLTGETIFLNVKASETVKQVRALLENCVGTAADQQRLTFAGAELEDAHTLSDYNVQNGALVTIGAVVGSSPVAGREFPTRSRSRSAARSQVLQMRLLVTTLTDETIRLDVKAADTIELVKDMIQTVTGTPVDLMRPVCGDHELPDGSALEELHIEHLSRIIMREPTRLSMPMRDEAAGNTHHYHVTLLKLTKSLDEGFAFLTQDYGAWRAHGGPCWTSELVGSNARICVCCRFCGAVRATVCSNNSGNLEAPPCYNTMMEAKQGSQLFIETVTFRPVRGNGVPSLEIFVQLSKDQPEVWFAEQEFDMCFE